MRNADTAETSGNEPPADTSDALLKGQTVGRYVIDRRVGSGGMGVVYVAFDPELDRRVAIKVLRTDLAETADERRRRLRLVREAQAQARLSHQNLTTVLDVGTHEGRVFVAMEFIDGWNLRQWLDESPRPWQQVLDAFIEAGRGLVAAHKAGLIHRDFKPQNVLIGRDHEVRVTDFGLARAIDREDLDPASSFSGEDALKVQLTHTGGMLGTPYYMAPEQHAAGETDERTDQFSFCVSLWEALYGEHPYGGKTAAEIFARIRAGSLREPVRRWIPDWIYLDLVRGLAPDPASRYDSMQDLLDSLTRDRSAARRRMWSTVLAVVGLAALAVVGFQRFAQPTERAAAPIEPAAVCGDAGAPIDAVWNDETRAALAASRADSLAWSAAHLDAIAREWKTLASDACERRDEGAQRCLRRRAIEVDAVAAVLSTADAAVAARAVDIVDAIGPLTDCSNAELTRSVLDSADTDAARADIARARALARAGKLDRAALDDAIDALTERGLEALVAEAKLIRADAALARGALDDAEQDLHAASTAAIACGHLGAEVDSFVALIRVARARGDHAAAQRWSAYAAAVENRVGADDVRLGHLSLARARMYRDAGASEEAVAHFALARDAYARSLGDTHPTLALVAIEHATEQMKTDPAAARDTLKAAKPAYWPPALSAQRAQLLNSE